MNIFGILGCVLTQAKELLFGNLLAVLARVPLPLLSMRFYSTLSSHLISLLFVQLSFQFSDKSYIYKFLLGDSTCTLQRVGKYAMLNARIFILHSSFSYRVGLKDVEHIDGLSMALSCFGCE
jgi:uncharacterized protein YacL